MRFIRNLAFNQSGFTLVEALISIVIMSGGLLALAIAMAQGAIVMSTAHYHQIAKEKASEAMESVFTSRDANKFASWNSIQNVSNGGIFQNGAQLMRLAGPDGLVNTADDLVDIEKDPGKNGIPGDGDDVPLNRFTREIQIANLSANLRQIDIVISYTAGNVTRQYRLRAFMSPFA
jgi:type II secretory pathway component PulJ